MKIELGATLEVAREKLKPLLARLREQRFWVRLAASTALVLAALAIVGRSAYARAEAIDREAIRLQQIQADLDRWAGTISWPTPEETEGWRESESFFQQLNRAQVQPISLANQLTVRGEEIGPADIQIRLASPDSAYVPPPQSVGDWVVTSGQTALVVEMTGDFGSMISFLGALPPQLELADLALTTTEGVTTMRLLLLSRDIAHAGP